MRVQACIGIYMYDVASSSDISCNDMEMLVQAESYLRVCLR